MKNKLIFLILPVSLILDILTETVFTKGGPIIYVRAIIFYSLIFYCIVNLFFSKFNITKPFLLFALYILIMIPFSTFPITSLRISLKVLMSILMFPVGFFLINNYKKLKILNNSLILFMIIYIVNFFISNYFKIGVSDYTKSDDFLVGSLADSWNNITYCLILLPILLHTSSKKIKYFILVLSIILLFMLVFSLKRIAIFVLILAYLIYFAKRFSFVNLVQYITILSFLIYLTLPYYSDLLLDRVESRGDKMQINNSDLITQEGRYSESIYVLKDIISFEDPTKVVFGLEPFNSVGFYGDGKFGDRQIHVDYFLILNTLGLVGIILYFNIFYFIYRIFKKLKLLVKDNYTNSLIKELFLILFISQFITSFGGQMYSTTFRIIIFLYLGSFTSILFSNYYLSKIK